MGTLIAGSEAEDGENSGQAGGATGSIWNRRRRRAGPSPPPAGSGPSNRSSESAKSEAPAAAAAAGRAESAAKRAPTAISRGGRWAGSTRRPLEAGRADVALRTARDGRLRGRVGKVRNRPRPAPSTGPFCLPGFPVRVLWPAASRAGGAPLARSARPAHDEDGRYTTCARVCSAPARRRRRRRSEP